MTGLALPKGPVAFASDEWFDCLAHANREAKRLGLELCLANCSGWTSSAGPWITPELAMKYVTNTTVRVKGGERFDGVLPLPRKTNGFYEDIAVLAFPTPTNGEAALHKLPDFELQVFRGRGSFKIGGLEMGPQMPVRVTERFAPPESCVASREIIDITSNLSPDGHLAWSAPTSHASWTILRIGYMANGNTNRSASKAGLGLECDKLEEQIIKDEILPAIGQDIEPRLRQIQRPLVLIVEYTPEDPISVKLSRKMNVAEALGAKQNEINLGRGDPVLCKEFSGRLFCHVSCSVLVIMLAPTLTPNLDAISPIVFAQPCCISFLPRTRLSAFLPISPNTGKVLRNVPTSTISSAPASIPCSMAFCFATSSGMPESINSPYKRPPSIFALW